MYACIRNWILNLKCTVSSVTLNIKDIHCLEMSNLLFAILSSDLPTEAMKC